MTTNQIHPNLQRELDQRSMTQQQDDLANNFVNYAGTNDPCRYDENGKRLIRVSWNEGTTWEYLTTSEWLQKSMVMGDLDNAPTAEEKSEMRAAFGTGTTVVNVLTGRKTRL
tara:strand:+ start:356 stop:691 length:336 start_codon:yes stop_codon:yes gene_type:complete